MEGFGQDEQLEAMLVQHDGREIVISWEEDVSLATKMGKSRYRRVEVEENSVTQ